jgi:hypothetical protein
MCIFDQSVQDNNDDVRIMNDAKTPYKNILHNESYLVVYGSYERVMAAVDVSLTNKEGFSPIILRNLNRHEFVPIIIYTNYVKIYKCPLCQETAYASNRYYIFKHGTRCGNANKIPVEA